MCATKPQLIQKQQVNHAGHQRYILGRNPKRYNEYGDELEDSESDAEADADAEEENAYGEVRIEGKHALTTRHFNLLPRVPTDRALLQNSCAL